MKNLRTLFFKARRGQTMILTVIALGGTLLGATTIAGLLLSYQIRQSTDLANSARAIYAADTGLEFSLYRFFRNPSQPAPSFTNGASVTVACFDDRGVRIADCAADNVYVIRSKGTAGSVSRAFELDF